MKKEAVEKARANTRGYLKAAGIPLGSLLQIEITDFGKGDFDRLGLALIVRVSEAEYASKWLVVLRGQSCPNHCHEKIKETFFLIRGDVILWVNGQETRMKPGDQITLPPGTWHKFTSDHGALIEEVTNRQVPDDSIFEDKSIQRCVSVE